MPEMGEVWTNIGAALATLAFMYTMFENFFPYRLREHIEPLATRLIDLVYPYVQIKFYEYSGERFEKNEDYATIQNYLSKDSSSRAKKLRANSSKGSRSMVLSMDDHEEITDEFEDIKVWWQSKKHPSENRSYSLYPKADESRFYMLKFHTRDRQVITDRYLDHVKSEGKKIEVQNRERKIYTNNPSENWSGYRQRKWSNVTFEHPATFDTLAMDYKKKEEIMNDLNKFSNSKDYYKKIGKAWKRGYLLFGPPGTGKSTMIAAMANHLDYDVYDLELTTVKDNTELRRLLIETSAKSIIVIEDIDCSLDLTGQRKKKKEEEDEDETSRVEKKMKKDQGENKESKVTLSGLLNFTDGLWSACGGERIIVFTTNFIDKLDPALIRKGRMGKRIEMSYCGFEAFKVLAKNYLDAEEEGNPDLFREIKKLLEVEEIKMTPADVGENLLRKSKHDAKETCLRRLIEALKEEKEEAKRKIEEEEEEESKMMKKEEKKIEKANIAAEYPFSQDISDMDQSNRFKRIANDIYLLLPNSTSSDLNDLVAMDRHMKVVHDLLASEANTEVRTIGIWGSTGVGKTTLARYLYAEISVKFQTYVFLENVENVKDRILEFEGEDQSVIRRLDHVGHDIAEARRKHRKVLLIADDVNNIEQGKWIIEYAKWFAPGSRVILISDNENLLSDAEVKHVYEVRSLRYDEALQLFSHFAFRQPYPPSDFEQLAVRAVHLAGFLPLALRLLGSFLNGKGQQEWVGALRKLKEKRSANIMEVWKLMEPFKIMEGKESAKDKGPEEREATEEIVEGKEVTKGKGQEEREAAAKIVEGEESAAKIVEGEESATKIGRGFGHIE